MRIESLPLYEQGSMIKSSIKTKLQWVRISQAWLIFFPDFEGNEKKIMVERTPTTTRSGQHLLPGPNATGAKLRSITYALTKSLWEPITEMTCRKVNPFHLAADMINCESPKFLERVNRDHRGLKNYQNPWG